MKILLPRWSAPLGCCLLLLHAMAPASNAADAPVVTRLKTSENIPFSILNQKPTAPAPTLFVFALDAERTLNSANYRQAANILADRGYLCVSLDLPCHGSERRPGEAAEIQGWRQRADAGDDFMKDFTGRASKVLDYLVEEGYADPDRVAACGTSRGGFSACHLAMADPRIKCVAAYIVVADLGAITEFRGAEDSPVVKSVSLIRNAEKLSDRGVWIAIGDDDQRVNTDRTIEFARALTKSAVARKTSRNIELHVASAEGHKTPAGMPELSAEWIDRTLNKR